MHGYRHGSGRASLGRTTTSASIRLSRIVLAFIMSTASTARYQRIVRAEKAMLTPLGAPVDIIDYSRLKVPLDDPCSGNVVRYIDPHFQVKLFRTLPPPRCR